MMLIRPLLALIPPARHKPGFLPASGRHYFVREGADHVLTNLASEMHLTK